jgi:hypothetical protein
MDINNPKTRKDWFGVLVAGLLFGFFILLVQGAYRSYENTFPPPDATSIIAAKEDWITYTNTNHGYQISYPPELKFTRSSELAARPAPEGEEDQLVLIADPVDNRIHNIVAGSSIEFTASSTAEMRKKYEEIVIPKLITGKTATGLGLTLTPADFKITEIIFNGRPAIEAVSQLGYKIVTLNTKGEVFIVLASQNYTGGTTTPKEQLTREIMETFRVLE